jgi:hemerythrin-like domain-containing protein
MAGPQVSDKWAVSGPAHARDMETAPRLMLRTRKPGEPESDLTSTVVIHRAILADLGRLAAQCDEVTARELPPAKSRATCRYAAALLDEVRAHCSDEESILWPLIAATAGPAVDLTLLTDDHPAIAAAAAQARRALAVTEAEAGAGMLASVAALARQLQWLLDEHFADEQDQIFPAARRYLPVAAYRWYEKQVRRAPGRPGLWFTAPWLAHHAQPGELSRLAVARGWRAWPLPGAGLAYAWLDRRAFDSGPHVRLAPTSSALSHPTPLNAHEGEER